MYAHKSHRLVRNNLEKVKQVFYSAAIMDCKVDTKIGTKIYTDWHILTQIDTDRH